MRAIDRLIHAIQEKKNPTVMGLDPQEKVIPEYVRSKYPKTLEGMSKAILEFNQALIDATHDLIPAVKPNIAFYEMFGLKGIEAFEKTCSYAKQKGLIVIADGKRGDIGSTAEAYSSAFLGRTKIGGEEIAVFDVDFLTVNPYLGTDGVNPFVEDCLKYDKGIFVLDKTSNPSAAELQNLEMTDGKKLYDQVAGLINSWGKDLIGDYGYSSVAAVVGATNPEELMSIRKTMPEIFFLIPGYGAQGGKAEDIARSFDERGLGGIVNASRSIMTAYTKTDQFAVEDYAQAARCEVIRMRDDLTGHIKMG